VTPVRFVCHGCGGAVDALAALPFRCPEAVAGDDTDHVLVPQDVARFTPRNSANPFLRYRQLLSPYRVVRAAGLPDSAWDDIVGHLDVALIAVDGKGFRTTPMAEQPALAQAIGMTGPLWVKDETDNVSGSHKARHLMGVMLYLRAIDAAHLPIAQGLTSRRLAIASCGNAALAAAVIARAANWPLDVFIPPDANVAVVKRLEELAARITVCEREPGQAGDPCFLRFREAVDAGAIPFGVQGSENGLAIEGGRTLAFEMADVFAASGTIPHAVYVQVGGGALASAVAQGFSLATMVGMIGRTPRLVTVQTAGCAPLARAWQKFAASGANAASHRSRYMWPWETTPASLAHGILDDETYDWLEIVQAMTATGGDSLVVNEDAVERACELARRYTSIQASATGTAGLAGLISNPAPGSAAVIFSGIDRPA
jgi:threonine synthase